MTPQEALNDAEKALHDLLTGSSAAEITDQNGEKIRYRPIDITKLNAYIADLKAQIAGTVRNVGPMRIWGRS
jgi:hypothetical protein